MVKKYIYLITGATWFIWRNLAYLLVFFGHTVFMLDEMTYVSNPAYISGIPDDKITFVKLYAVIKKSSQSKIYNIGGNCDRLGWGGNGQ